MSEENQKTDKSDRRSKRLTISIPVVISGVDALGNEFSERVRTLIVNKHGAKIATTQHLLMGKELLIENHPLGVTAKASVVWLGGKHYAGDLHHVGLQLVEAQNIWGIAFPPDDWGLERGEEPPAPLDDLPASERANAAAADAHTSPPSDEEIAHRHLQKMRSSADAQAKEFHDRLKLIARRLMLEMEFDIHERAENARAHAVGAVEEEIKVLKASLSAVQEEMGKLEATIQELQAKLEATGGNPPTAPLEEAKRQLVALSNTVIENMNRAAEDGLQEYRSLLQKENQENTARGRLDAEGSPSLPAGPAPES